LIRTTEEQVLTAVERAFAERKQTYKPSDLVKIQAVKKNGIIDLSFTFYGQS
jgi:hypothetical protein